ncbi:MAG: hypothetical protein HFI75_00770 [Lachnospiraceae bacterium]|nr:hypothetical protein [Lachnospiraceae bacterium]
MREILFRAKRTDNGEWIYGYYAVIRERHVIIKAQSEDYYSVDDNIKKSHGNEVVEINSETVGQYTGLKDKADKKIFEGDILNVTYSDRQGECHHAENYVLDDLRTTSVIGWLDFANELEVIDNIFDTEE